MREKDEGVRKNEIIHEGIGIHRERRMLDQGGVEGMVEWKKRMRERERERERE